MRDFITFYNNLKKYEIPVRQLLKDESLFTSVPKNWYVVVTDIEASSKAVRNGYHNDVNIAATGSIITVLNEIKRIDKTLKIPYFFGGDGATFLVPEAICSSIIVKLNVYSIHIKNTLDLNLRVGNVSLEDVYKENVTLRIAKIIHNSYLTTPIILGNGLKFAESKIKNEFNNSNRLNEESTPVDLTGMECRWDEIVPNRSDKKVICLLVSCNDEKKQAQVFNNIMSEINYVFGSLEERKPITIAKLKLDTSLAKIKKEMLIRIGDHNKNYLLRNWLLTLFGKYYFVFFREGKRYLHSVTQLSDTIMFDGGINTVISGNFKQINKFQIFLDTLESQNVITYGMHVTHAAIMSCYVQDRKKNHIHFVDGTEGGYTTAAKAYKKKLRASPFYS